MACRRRGHFGSGDASWLAAVPGTHGRFVSRNDFNVKVTGAPPEFRSDKGIIYMLQVANLHNKKVVGRKNLQS